jgi:hypothetical protein
MTTNEPSADAPAEFPDFAVPDDKAIRRIVRRGVLRTSVVAVLWLMVAGLLVLVAGHGVSAARGERFHDVVFLGAQVGRPEYQVSGSSCCSDALGFTNTLERTLLPRGVVAGANPLTARIRQGPTGAVDPELPDDPAAPVASALRRERPTKAGTRTFLDGLPPAVAASAIIELSRPLSEAEFQSLSRPSGVSHGGAAVFLTDPYLDGPRVSWPSTDLASYVRWADGLSSDDDETLQKLGAAPAGVLRDIATDPRIHAFVLGRATPAELRALLADPGVRSVNVADVGFDPDLQLGQP